MSSTPPSGEETSRRWGCSPEIFGCSTTAWCKPSPRSTTRPCRSTYLFLDTSPSLSGLLEELKRDMAKIAAMLRPGDRLRLLTFGYQVDDVFGWRPAGTDLPLEIARVGRLSSVSDAVLLALLHRPQVDRRHLVIAMTDAMDAGSQVEMSQLRAVSARAEAVLHVMVMPSSYMPPPNMPGPWGVGSQHSSARRSRRSPSAQADACTQSTTVASPS